MRNAWCGKHSEGLGGWRAAAAATAATKALINNKRHSALPSSKDTDELLLGGLAAGLNPNCRAADTQTRISLCGCMWRIYSLRGGNVLKGGSPVSLFLTAENFLAEVGKMDE